MKDVIFIKGDINCPRIIYNIKKQSDKFDIILSDAMINISGQRQTDHEESLDLAFSIINAADNLLSYNGNLIFKILEGEKINDFIKTLNKKYKKCHH